MNLLKTKVIRFCLIWLFLLNSAGAAFQENNDFYDNLSPVVLQGPRVIKVDGLVLNPGEVDLEKLPERDIIVRETEFSAQKKVGFKGAYHYYGYSLFDILKEKYIDYRNKQLKTPIDLIIEVVGKEGEKVVLSWGEVFYPRVLHRIIIVTKVSPILPSKTNDRWPLPRKTRLVVGDDLLSARSLIEPIKIIISRADCPQEVTRKEITKGKLYSPAVAIYYKTKKLDYLEIIKGQELRVHPTIFYGRGRGFHGLRRFTGYPLQEILGKYFQVNEETLKHNFLVVRGVDGYQVCFSFSEIFNRSDFAEILIVERGKEGGKFALFPSPDFFSDRAVKAIEAICLQSIISNH